MSSSVMRLIVYQKLASKHLLTHIDVEQKVWQILNFKNKTLTLEVCIYFLFCMNLLKGYHFIVTKPTTED